MLVCCGLLAGHAEAHSTPDATVSTIGSATVIPPVQQKSAHERRQMLCLALAIYHEARSERPEGQRAVGDVILNRIHQTGQTICQTVWRKDQFTWTEKSNDALKPHELLAWYAVQWTAIDMVQYNLPDVTYGATMFYNARFCHPNWRGEVTARIGDHVFMRPSS